MMMIYTMIYLFTTPFFQGKSGGALGTFKQGQMVPAFDKVVFNEELGVIHGPIKTPFGAS